MVGRVAGRAGAALFLVAAVAGVGPVQASSPATPGWATSLSIRGDGSTVEGLARAPGGSVLWAVGDRSTPPIYDKPTVWRYDGSEWTARRIPVDLTGRRGYVLDVAAVSDTDVWVVGRTTVNGSGSSRPFVAHLAGGRWTLVDEAWTTPGSDAVMSAVTAHAADDVWVFGNEGTVWEAMAWHFDGRFWSKEAIRIQNRSCNFPQASDVTDAVATDDGTYVASHCSSKTARRAASVSYFNGQRWRTELSGIDGSIVHGLGADPSGKVWAAGVESDDAGGHAQAWYGQAGPFTSLGLAGPRFSELTDVSATNDLIAFSGVVSEYGFHPYVLTGTPEDLAETDVPYNRRPSGVLVDPDGRLWVGGPSSGTWLGGDKSRARILTWERAAG